MKKYFALLLVFVFVFTAVGCSAGGNGDGDGDVSETVNSSQRGLTLLYCATDSLNPYQAKTKVNRELVTLLFDPLVKLNDSFEPQYILAESATVAGKTCTVTLRDAVFSDGSKITNDDVVYSYKLAKDATDQVYASELYEVTSCTCGDGNSVIFKLTKSDPYFANLLSFPIIKANSEKRTDEDKIVLPPIGSGYYTVDTSSAALFANQSHLGGTANVKTIGLINAPDDDIVSYNLEAGNVSIYGTDLYDGIIPSMPGNYIKFHLNSLVFVGVNCKSGAMKNVSLRYAVSDIIDRESICETCFYSYATPAAGLFNAAWADAAGSQNIQSKAVTQNLVAYFEQLGYNSKDDDGYYQNSVKNTVTLRLICNAENTSHKLTAENVAKKLNDIGLKTNLRELSKEEYLADLASGYFDLYIGEVKLLNNMDVTSIVTSGGKLAYGLKTSSTDAKADTSSKTSSKAASSTSSKTASSTASSSKDVGATEDGKADGGAKVDDTLDNAVKGFYGEKLSLIDIINAFNAEMPIIPICHRQGITVCSTYLSVSDISSPDDIYYGLQNISIK